MSRSGYSEDCENDWALICYRGAVKSATRGKRGQTFFRDLLTALDAMPNKRLIADELESNGEFCAIGVLGNARKMDMSKIDPHDPEAVSSRFDIAESLAREVVYENDENYYWLDETSEKRWIRMRKWVENQIAA